MPELVFGKRIGRVVFLVEGPKDEPELLLELFHRLLGYRVVVYDKRYGTVTECGAANDPYSQVFVVSMPTSAIAHLPGDEAFFDTVYGILKEYGLERVNARYFYLFDRDRQSNKPDAVLRAITRLRNPLDNGVELPGALLLSYPCLQAYYCQAHDDPARFANGKSIKKHVNTTYAKSLTPSEALTASSMMLGEMLSLRGVTFDVEELADYAPLNETVFRAQERVWENDGHLYRTLSLLSLALIDLGIIDLGEPR